MKLISLNIFGGRVGNSLVDFVKSKADEVDIFCFQEVYNGDKVLKAEDSTVFNIHSILSSVLPNHTDFYACAYEVIKNEKCIPYGLAMFVRKGIEVKAEGSYEIFKITDDLGLPEDIKIWNRLLQYITVPYKNSEITIFNLHGLYTGGGKGDGIARLEQSRKVSNFMRNHRGSKILCGDFNLNPETESIKIFEEGMVNLIKEKGIVSTRSHIYSGDNKYADYIFTSPDVAVLHFEVLQDTVSDHLPLYIEF